MNRCASCTLPRKEESLLNSKFINSFDILRYVLSEPDGMGRLCHGDERDLGQEYRQPGRETCHEVQGLQGGAVTRAGSAAYIEDCDYFTVF